MTPDLTPGRFSAADGSGDWRVLFSGADAHFRTGPYEAAVAQRHGRDVDRRRST
jgi:hypothetical protein